MVKFATTIPQKTGIITTHHQNGGISQHNQKHTKKGATIGNLGSLQPTTVHIQVQHGKNGQQQISLQPNDFATSIVTNGVHQGSNGVVHLQSPSHPQRTATLLAQNMKVQQSPTNIQVQNS